MTNGKKLCLNMIVRNETANLPSCLGAVAGHIDCWVIADTGSTDGTQEFITAFFAERGLPGELTNVPFENFQQARNHALDCAYASSLDYDYLLLADADMELVVEDNDFRNRLDWPGYRLLQRTSSGLTYWNTRLLQRRAGARYHGVTHEYVNVPGGQKELHGVWYKDHASGSNRVDKFERDIRLLSAALETEPDNGRYWFYLAQSYRDAGRTAEAAQAYGKRAEMGGWEEEAWNARLHWARCLRQLGDDGGFLKQAMAAFDERPHRAEPLYELARFYREKGMNDASVLFSEPGLGMRRPDQDILFLEDYVYTAGLREEFSIAANYSADSNRKDRGFAVCNALALNPQIAAGPRELARSNLFFYLDFARTIIPSFATRRIEFTPPQGYSPCNPSVARLGDQIVLVQRTVNYTLNEEGQYIIPDGAGIHTRNFLLRLSNELEVQSSAEILPPADLPERVYDQVLGFEDSRAFAWHGQLWVISCVRELTQEGWCEQVLARLGEPKPGQYQLTDWRVLHPEGPRLHEKNWMPRVDGDRLEFLYSCDPTRVLDERARQVSEAASTIEAKGFRGGSQLIAFDGGWLGLIHEVQWRPTTQLRCYFHRFVWLDETNRLRRVSRPFFFNGTGVEFAAGLAWHPDGKRLLISYSVADNEAWIATADAAHVRVALEDVASLSQTAATTFDQTAVLPPSVDAGPDSKNESVGAEQRRNLDAKEDGKGHHVRSQNGHQRRRRDKQPGRSATAVVDHPRLSSSVRSGISASPDSSVAAPMRLSTAHGTVLYVDPDSGDLLHGRPDEVLENAGLLANGSHGRLVYQVNGSAHPIICFLDCCKILDSVNKRDGPFTPTTLKIVELEDGALAFKSNGLFLCADPEGRVTLSRSVCSEWEKFRLDPPEIGRAPANPTEQTFLDLAPYLRLADSPPERRKRSFKSDERIRDCLAFGATSFPQIHCFYEVLSENSDHRSLIAATSSMRAAGHPVCVWTYSPPKLDFLRPHGIELRSANEIMPRSLFETISAGSEIRYFSDIFRYAVLYEHGGLWMDTDVVLLRPFPFRGDYFFNLQWRSGGKHDHFICGNVMYAAAHSHHLRKLYEASIERFSASGPKAFGDIGPKLLSEYIASAEGAELQDWLFSPMFFNSIDWTEIGLFDEPPAQLAEYLNDERVFGIHLWTGRNAAPGADRDSLRSLLSDPLSSFPSFTSLADCFDTDKNRISGNRHSYSRVYDRLLASRRFSLRRLMEIGLCRGLAERNQTDTPSLGLWQSFFPFAQVIGVDVTDFSKLNNERTISFVCDQSNVDQLRAVAAKLEPGSIDVIVDDGSHASHDQQLTLIEFWPLLAGGGWYFIEDLDWQPPGEDAALITASKTLLREIKDHGCTCSLDPFGLNSLAGEMLEILFFDSHYELARAKSLGGLVAIRKRGGSGLVH